MPFILVKNNLKLMLRSKWILFLMIIVPLITIALLSNAFKEMLNSSYQIKEFKVGYRLNENSDYKNMISGLVSNCKSKGILLQEFPAGDIDKLLKNKTVSVFVDITDNSSYKIYQSSDDKTEAAIVESIFTGFFYQINDAMLTGVYATQNHVEDIPVPKDITINHEKLNTDPIPSSTDYYGIIYIVYFSMCGMVSLLAVISSERKSAIPRRMQVSHMPKFHYYMGKFLPCTLAVLIEICSAWVLSVLLFGIHWGNIGLSILIVFLVSMLSSAFGILLFQLFNSVAISIVVGFVITWIWGFFGGSFQTYMYSHLPEWLVNTSPIYYINRTLVEFSTQGHSDYTVKCILVLTGSIILFGLAGMLLMNRKLEEQ